METTMELPVKLLDCASRDETRPILMGAHIDAEQRLIVVCNGKALTKRPIPGDQPVKAGYITPEVWKLAKVKKKAKEPMLLDYAAGTLCGVPLAEVAEVGDYPNWQQAWPEEPVRYRIHLDPKLLLEVANSLGCPQAKQQAICMEFDESGMVPIRIRFGEADGLLMPCRGADDNGLVESGNSAAARTAAEEMRARLADAAEHPFAWEDEQEDDD